MLNLLKDYICHSIPEKGVLKTNPNLEKKVDPKGEFLPFRGNTVVFALEEQEKESLAQLRDELYAAVPEMLAQPLDTDTFHLTLHDLVNSPAGNADLEERMSSAARKAEEILPQWREDPPLVLRSTWVFNMVNTSVVLGFEPWDAQTGKRLEKMYEQLETVVPLGYPMTPHITLAYFRPGVYGQAQLVRLRRVLKPVALSVTLKPEKLLLQNFENMNHYTLAK